jgi:DNA gyrase subunit B
MRRDRLSLLNGTGRIMTETSQGMDERVDTAYDAASILILSGLEAVRRNPTMYIGSTGAPGLHQLVFELLDNAVDESVAGYGKAIEITLHKDGSCSVADEGRGIPTGIHPEVQRPACEVVLTTLHSGAKFEDVHYATSAGLHGVGAACVNALAAWLRMDVRQNGTHYTQTYYRGEPAGPLENLGCTARTGTRIQFLPDSSILRSCEFSPQTITGRLEELAFLHPGLRLTLTDERSGKRESFSSTGGIRAFLASRSSGATLVHSEPIVVTGDVGTISFEVAFHWTEGYAEEIWSYVNTLRTDHGGEHVDGLRTGLARAINRYADDHDMLGALSGQRITTVDILEGLIAVIAVTMDHPKFDGQTKKRLQSPETAEFVRTSVESALTRRLEADEELGRRIVERVLDATRSRLAARLAARTARIQPRKVEIDYDAYRRQFGIRSRNWHDSCSWLTDEGLLGTHAELYDAPADARMLDVCCGSGVVGNSFRDKVGKMVGLDITPEMVRLASTRLDEVHEGTVYDLPFADSSFDIVVNREVLHLLPRPEQPMSEIFRVLQPGGQFIVGQIVPYSEVDAFWMFRIFKKKQPLLCQMFLEAEFRDLLLGAGFRDLTMKEYLLWESIDLWIDTHETTPVHRQEIYRLFYDAPPEIRAVHPFEIAADGSVRDQWRWCVYSAKKPR